MERGVFLFASLLLMMPVMAIAKGVYAEGYYRSGGTHVRPHIKSAPSGIKWSNYGPSQKSSEFILLRM